MRAVCLLLATLVVVPAWGVAHAQTTDPVVEAAAFQTRLAALSALLNSVAVPENAGRAATAEERDRLRQVETGAEKLYHDAKAAGALPAQAAARQLSGSVFLLTGRFNDAVKSLRESADLFRQAGDPTTAAQIEALAQMAAHPAGH